MPIKNTEKDKLINIFFISTLSLIFIAIIVMIFIPNKKADSTQEREVIDHNLYILKEDGTFSKYNTNSKKYLSEIKVSTNEAIHIDSFNNPYHILSYNDQFIITSPNSKEIIFISEKNNKLTESLKIELDNVPNNIDIIDSTLAVSYLESPQIDFFDTKTKDKINTLKLENNVDSIEMDKTTLYVGHGNYIELFNKDTELKNEKIKMFTGARVSSLLKASDGFLYAGNIFASDSKNSLLLKIDLKNNNIADLLELEKEYPINISEKGSDLIIICKGLEDSILDGVSVIDKDLFSRKTNVSTGNTPNNITFVGTDFSYVSHDDGQVTLIDMRDGYEKHSTFNLHGIRALLNK